MRMTSREDIFGGKLSWTTEGNFRAKLSSIIILEAWKMIIMRMRIISREIIFDGIPLDVEYYHGGEDSFRRSNLLIWKQLQGVAVFKRDGIL